MSVRSARYQELCRQCGEQTDLNCYRCKAPLCEAHMPKRGKRCGACERAFKRWPSREPMVLAMGGLLAAAWIGASVILLALHPAAAATWALMFPLIVGRIAQRRLVSGRQLFLAEQTRLEHITDPRHQTSRSTSADN